MMDLYNDTCAACSKIITNRYSTSFSLGIKAFDKKYRDPIYAIYGFVRYADEIVDTFHDHNKRELFDAFRADTYRAFNMGISLNPVLHSFQLQVKQYNIPMELIDAFLHSMEMDLDTNTHHEASYETYIYGSAEVIGLMCLMVFCNGDVQHYQHLLPHARSLGAAFQKINFLRDIQSDYQERGRVYFPNLKFDHFDETSKKEIEADIQKDFDHALLGIKQLPTGARLGVFIAYRYYLDLFRKIKNTPASRVAQKRIRIADTRKIYLYLQAMIENKFMAA